MVEESKNMDKFFRDESLLKTRFRGFSSSHQFEQE